MNIIYYKFTILEIYYEREISSKIKVFKVSGNFSLALSKRAKFRFLNNDKQS